MADHDPTSMIGSFLGGGFLATVATTLIQAFRKPSAPSEMIAAAAAVAEQMMDRQQHQIDQLEKKVDGMEAKHHECETRLSESEADREELRRKIDDLMAGRIAAPGEPDLFR